MAEFLHERRDFGQLIAIVAEQRGIDPTLVEKDYWIMHCLWGLQAQGFRFELKGGNFALERLWHHPPFFRRYRYPGRATR